MASYEYSDLYFDVYYLFVTDTDTGHGAEGTPSIKVPKSSSDTGSVNPSTGETGTVIRVVSSSDTGHGADAGESVHAALSSSDTGSVNPSTGETGVAGQRVSSSDTALGTDAVTKIGLTDRDNTTATEIDAIADSDLGTAAEGQSFTLADEDSISTAEVEQHIGITDPDFNQGSVELLNWTIAFSDADVMSSLETATGGKKISSTDASNPTTEFQSYVPGARDTDAAIATEEEAILGTGYDDGDSFTATEDSSITVPVTSSDTGHGTDAQLTGPKDGDTGTVIGSYSSVYTSSYPVGGGEAGSIHAYADTDTGGADPVHGEAGAFPNNKFDVDVLHADDASTIVATSHDGDSGSVPDGNGFSGGEGSYVDVPAWYGKMEESFSVTHCAILDRSTGAEAAQLLAVRSGTITPAVQAYDQLADDMHIGVWFDITSAQVDVQVGFLSWDAMRDTLGYTVTQDGDTAALAYGASGMPSTHEVPMMLRTTSRDAYGKIRTIDFILYRVRLWLTTGGDAFAYKQGLQVSMIGNALPSAVDETGTPLPSTYWSNATGYSFGRIVSSPGAPALAAAGSYGEGS